MPFSLYEHQNIALPVLKRMEREGKGGFLADECGLGKWGGIGLNLMPCATVFLSEPYYNPFLEKQAEERVHRLGQEHQVNVYRFSMENSVETWVNGLKQKKLFLAAGLDLLAPHEESPMDFSFKDLANLFTDLVGIPSEDEKERHRNARRDHIRGAVERDLVQGMDRWNDQHTTWVVDTSFIRIAWIPGRISTTRAQCANGVLEYCK